MSIYISFAIYSRIILLFVVLLVCIHASSEEMEKNDYIAFMSDSSLKEDFALHQMHIDTLSVVKGSEVDARESHIYSYKNFNAFAAKLYEDEATELSKMDGVINVIKSGESKLHTTRSWDFLGFSIEANRNLEIERDIIVGVIDTGITPESESFNDDGLGPPPKKWKGSCGLYADFCNNKLIGVKSFKDGKKAKTLSPRDETGHGTHTSSTAVGALVPNANLFGLAQGTSRGAVPGARVAMYKVCWLDLYNNLHCKDIDILAAFDEAIDDGVDVISISIGRDDITKYSHDLIAIGAFRAFRNGITTVASAGNNGPKYGTVENHAPWIVTVAASSIDRQFRNKIEMGNGMSFSGVSLNLFNTTPKYPVVRGVDAAKSEQSKYNASLCQQQSLESEKIEGKIVYCKISLDFAAEHAIKKLGGIGVIMVLENNYFLDTAYIHNAPVAIINAAEGRTTSKYITSTKSPTGVIYKSEQVKIQAPLVASFSSRGPNPVSLNVPKPDLTAPGIDILASFSPFIPQKKGEGSKLYANFTIMSGTSMSCPHVSGVAAYVKSFHPTWSPAAIKSAIMTTATPMSSESNKGAEFDYGAGQLNPGGAINPGLVYDEEKLSFIRFLCDERNYTNREIASIVGSEFSNCSSLNPSCGSDAVNYPSILLYFDGKNETITRIFCRSVTNVGNSESEYDAIISAPKGVEITVEPMKLRFDYILERKKFTVTVKAYPQYIRKQIVSGSLIWKNSKYSVRSPIVVYNRIWEKAFTDKCSPKLLFNLLFFLFYLVLV